MLNWKRGVVGIMVLGMLGCNALQNQVVPLHDEVLIYELPYDLTYLRTVEASQEVPGWEIEETDKNQGIVRVRNLQFSRFDDADKRLVTLLLTREGRNMTSIRLAPESQRVIGGDKVLETVAQFVSAEL